MLSGSLFPTAPGLARARYRGKLRARVLFGTFTDQLAELENYRVCNRVIYTISLAASGEETGITECLQVFRYVWLGRAENFRHVADAALALFEHLENAQSYWLAEHAKAASDKLDHLA